MTRTPGSELRPRLRSRYPLRRSAHYHQDLADGVDRWFLSWGLLPDPRQQTVFRQTNHTYLAAVCWPAADRDTLYDLARLAAALMARDHQIDTAPHDHALDTARAFLTEVRTQYAHPAAEGTDPRWAPVFTDLWLSLAAHSSPRFMTRLADSIADFLTGCLTYRQTTATGGHPRDLTHYLRTRRTTIAQRIDHLLTELSLCIELDDTVLTHPLMDRLLFLDVERTILVQDILSAPRELADGETENVLAVLAAEHRCTPAEALPDALRLYEQAMDAYDHTHSHLLHTDLSRQPHLRAYLTALNDFNTGLIEWTTNSVRYTRSPIAHWTIPDEIVHPGNNSPGTRNLPAPTPSPQQNN
ncbi:hypothetical protein QQY66_34095 [Streptomyces sp. DG2A-72]|uniref:terpene synthase family protein n=1 Tax=Streptomyces sp. DG2A-72 TaxID=3051386 RepID=UPI00265C43B8|nr:hypothetical protein [Streptomyces sp. DG2A-72]MDO0936492.1 hypothetical protein [Streptomyces sp. DG2A-72]